MTSKGTCCCGCGGEGQFSALAPVLEKYGKVPGSLITILQSAQDIYGYLSAEAIHYIAERTGIQPAKSTAWPLFIPSSASSPSAST